MRFLIIDNEQKAEQAVKLNLVKDAGGSLVEEHCLGMIVECKPPIGRALDLIEIVHLKEVYA
jgi:hypothetical protein